jgi:hypothetical protein
MLSALRTFFTVCSFLFFIVNYPELHGLLAILLFFVAFGFLHYVLWGRAMTRALRAESVQSLESGDEYADPPLDYEQYEQRTTDYTDYTEPAR